jgi:hypothetical protein
MIKLKGILKQIDFVESTLQTDIIPAMNRESSEGGYHSTIKLIFSYVDFFGALYKNDVSSQSAVEFIKKYFGKINSQYERNAGIIYSTFRHGTIHTISPKKIEINGTTFLWLIGKKCDILYQNNLSTFVWKKDEKGDGFPYVHLIPQKPNNPALIKRYKKVLMFPISLEQLFEDLGLAIEFYKNDLIAGSQLETNAIEMLKKINRASVFSVSSKGNVEENIPSLRSNLKRKEIDPSELVNIFLITR